MRRLKKRHKSCKSWNNNNFLCADKKLSGDISSCSAVSCDTAIKVSVKLTQTSKVIVEICPSSNQTKDDWNDYQPFSPDGTWGHQIPSKRQYFCAQSVDFIFYPLCCNSRFLLPSPLTSKITLVETDMKNLISCVTAIKHEIWCRS